jgi:hypothetical protein
MQRHYPVSGTLAEITHRLSRISTNREHNHAHRQHRARRHQLQVRSGWRGRGQVLIAHLLSARKGTIACATDREILHATQACLAAGKRNACRGPPQAPPFPHVIAAGVCDPKIVSTAIPYQRRVSGRNVDIAESSRMTDAVEKGLIALPNGDSAVSPHCHTSAADRFPRAKGLEPLQTRSNALFLPEVSTTEYCRRAMLSVPTKGFRVKAAIALAALYALCILAPSAAFAFSNNPSIAHCLIEGHTATTAHDHGTTTVHDHGGKVHVHADGTAHQHHDDGSAQKHPSDGGKADVATCCGLFSVVAVASEPDLILGLSSTASILLPALREALSGRGPERINRPPISLLSL